MDIGKIGVEIELLAPLKKSRRDLAEALATQYNASVRQSFHPQAEPSKAPNTPYFENLTQGFIVEDSQGNIIAQCVDDLTLQNDLNKRCKPKPGWYRIISDDTRLLRLIMLHTDPTAPLSEVLLPIADLFSTKMQKNGEMYRIADHTDAPIAIATTLPGERERPCELITPPFENDHLKRLEELLEPARSMGFLIPDEGATHLHYDATELCSASTLANLVRFLDVHGNALKNHVGTNPNCRRLGSWSSDLIKLVSMEEFVELEWADARETLLQFDLTKFCDFNIRNFIYNTPDKHTFEVRILPVWIDARKIIETATLFATIIDWAKENNGKLKPIPENLDRFTLT